MNRLRTIAIFLIISLQVRAQHDSVISAIDVYGFEHELTVTSKLSFFIDSLANSDINRVLQQNFQDSFRIYDDSLNQNPQKHIFWLKFGVKNISDKPLLLHLYCGDLDYIDLFFITDHKIDQKALGGELRRSSASSSFIERTSMTLPLRIRAGQSGEIYIRYCQKSQEYSFGGIEIYDQENLYASYANDYEHSRYFVFFQQLFQGFLLCQLLYVLFQWMIIRRPEYLYYACYLLLIAVYFLSKYESIYGISFIFSKYPLLKIYLNKTLIISPYYFYFRFVRSFLEMRDNYPRLNRWIIWIEYFLLFYLAFDLVFIMTTFNIPLQRKIYT
ncbi:MAG TPA: 7TM-DISM domain-containing protein, partial [Puia sp.]|nr:7TM-DISM domain-containing protein [Puia sp.]